MSSEKSKGGRPKSDNPKKKTVTIRVTMEEYDRLMEFSQKRGMTMTQVLVEGLNKVYSDTSI